LKVTDRVITAITFMPVGPLVGGLWLWCISTGSQLWRGAPDGFSSALSGLPIVLGVAYLAGFLPAAVTGGVYAALPAAWQRVIVSLIIGATVTWLLWEVLQMAFEGPPSPRVTYFVLVGAGAAAAAVSAFAARQILRLFGREYEHYGGIGGGGRGPFE